VSGSPRKAEPLTEIDARPPGAGDAPVS
jgi:hypothetical protein